MAFCAADILARAAVAAIGEVVTVRSFAVEFTNPKHLALVQFFDGALLDNFRYEIFPAVFFDSRLNGRTTSIALVFFQAYFERSRVCPM